MTLNIRVTDDQFGKFHRRVAAIADRLGKSLDFDDVMAALQRIHDGKFGSVDVDSDDAFLVVNFNNSLKNMISAGNYNYVHPHIHFPVEKFSVTGRGVKKYRHKLFRFDRHMSPEALVDAMRVEGFTPAGHEHGLAYGAKFPEEHLKHTSIICPGSLAQVDSGSVLDLYGRGVERNLGLHWPDGGWSNRSFYLGVQEVSDTA